MGNVGAIRMICRITAGSGFSIAKKHAAIRMLIFQDENPSCVEAVWKRFESLVLKRVPTKFLTWSKWDGVATFLEGVDRYLKLSRFFNGTSSLQRSAEIWKRWRESWTIHKPICRMFWTYMHVTALDGSYMYGSVFLRFAQRGHWEVVEAVLEEAESLKTVSGSSHPTSPPTNLLLVLWNNFLYRAVVIIAAKRNDFSSFSEKLPELENVILDVSFLSVLLREAQPDFMDNTKVVVLCKLRLRHNRAKDFHGTFLQELQYIFSEEIRSNACPCHRDYLMQGIFAQTFVSVKILAPFLLVLLLATKRVFVVKRVLLFFIDDVFLDLQDYKFDRCLESLWMRGVRLEAGVKASSPVPAKYTELFSLSFQDKCLITVRGCLKLPVREGVQKLPLPPSLKRRLLYRFWSSVGTQMKYICETRSYPFRDCLSGHS